MHIVHTMMKSEALINEGVLKTTKYEIKTLVHKEIYIGDPRKAVLKN